MNQRTLTRPFNLRATVAGQGVENPTARQPSQPARLVRRLAVPILLVVLWQLVTNSGICSRGQLPAPLDVYRAGRQLWHINELWPDIRVSALRVGQGFTIGAGIAVALGLLIGLSRLAEELLDPTIQAIRTVPSLAWVPLFVLWMGIGERPKIILIAVGVFFPVYTNLVAGIRQLDRKLIEAASAYGYEGFSLAWNVLLPASLPSLFTGLRIGLAQGWLFLVAAELIGAYQGLGFLLVDGENSGRSDTIVLAILILAVIGKLSDWGLQLLERRLLRWTDTFQGGR